MPAPPPVFIEVCPVLLLYDDFIERCASGVRRGGQVESRKE